MRIIIKPILTPRYAGSDRKFLEAEIVPNMEKWQEQGIVDREAFKKAGDQGFLMIWPDEQYGGLGDSDFRFEQIIMEETHRVGCASWLNTLHRIYHVFFWP